MPDEYAGWNSATKQICLLGNQSMPDHKGAVKVPQLADSSWNLSPLQFFGDCSIRHRLTFDNFIDQSFRHYANVQIPPKAPIIFYSVHYLEFVWFYRYIHRFLSSFVELRLFCIMFFFWRSLVKHYNDST